MAECLGIYVENNIIKYAKVSKATKNSKEIKIDAFGVKFYDNFASAVRQVIEETYSYNKPISINLTNEKYTYFDMYASLKKTDLSKAVDLEFETFCSDNRINPKSQETRFAAAKSTENPDRLRIIHIRDEISNLIQLKQNFTKGKLTCITPVSTAIPTLIKPNPKENILIVNIEDKTTITTIFDQQIYNIQEIEEGSGEILNRIAAKVNSYSKAYEICRDTTIYTSELQDYMTENENYLEDIVPTLYSILGKLQRILNESPEKINKIYITGTGANVNNIDLYFQEYLGTVKCEILRPYFVQGASREFNIKEYIEVNSATALALQGLDEGIDGLNFKTSRISDKITPEAAKNIFKTDFFKNDFKELLSKEEKNILRICASLLVFIIVYGVLSGALTKKMNSKGNEAVVREAQIKSEAGKIDTDTGKLNKRAEEYQTLLAQLKASNEKTKSINESKNCIPNLLNQIMFVIPENVQLTSITNSSEKSVTIEAQCENYEELGYLAARIKTDKILTDVSASKGVKQDGMVKITIKGELP